jgi:prepilin-type N-terminal cleavage/methylation domain-containing protein
MNPSLLRRAHPQARGFTLIEILVVIGMLAILTTVVLVAVNPSRMFAQARNSQRQANVATILNAVGNRIADTQGNFVSSDMMTCPPLTAGTEYTITNDENLEDSLDLRSCLVPHYLPEMPVDPELGQNTCTDTDCADGLYYAYYTIERDVETGRVTVCAPQSAEESIPDSQPFCLTR